MPARSRNQITRPMGAAGELRPPPGLDKLVSPELFPGKLEPRKRQTPGFLASV